MSKVSDPIGIFLLFPVEPHFLLLHFPTFFSCLPPYLPAFLPPFLLISQSCLLPYLCSALLAVHYSITLSFCLSLAPLSVVFISQLSSSCSLLQSSTLTCLSSVLVHVFLSLYLLRFGPPAASGGACRETLTAIWEVKSGVLWVWTRAPEIVIVKEKMCYGLPCFEMLSIHCVYSKLPVTIEKHVMSPKWFKTKYFGSKWLYLMRLD